MRTIKFNDIEVWDHNIFPPKNNNSGLFQTLFTGYCEHRPVEISPDDFLNTIVTLWSKYVNIHAEAFRHHFVEHSGRKKLEYVSGGTYSEGRHQEFLDGLIDLVKKDQASDHFAWADLNFSTTVAQDRLIRSAASLASQKKYYEYHCTLLCGLPEIRLSGTEQDWFSLYLSIESMPVFDSGMSNWKKQLLGILTHFVSANEDFDFWQSVITKTPMGSGHQDYEGWVIVFSPFKENGEWHRKSIAPEEVLNCEVDFEINVDDNGNKFVLNCSSGVDGAEENEDGSIKPNKRIEFVKRDDYAEAMARESEANVKIES